MPRVRTAAGRTVPDRVFYDAINRAVLLMTMHLDQALTPASLDAIGADDCEAMRALLEDRLEGRFLGLSRVPA